MSNSGLPIAAALLAIICPLPLAIVNAQKPSSAATQPNQQLRDFDFVVEKITTNYAGYDTKVTPERKAELAALTAGLRARAATASDEQLEALLKEWIGFFRDRHTSINRLGAGAVGLNRSTARMIPAITEEQARTRLEALGTRRDPVEGIWRIGDNYRVAVLRSDSRATRFNAIVLDAKTDGWKPVYLDLAKALRTELDTIEGFVSIERFESLTTPGKILSLSIWQDEAALTRWRAHAKHRLAQGQGRHDVFADYRLRVASVIRDYGLNDRAQAPADRAWQ